MVARRRLAGENLHPRHPVPHRLGADRVVERDGLQDVQQLALVFVDALDLHIEHRIRVEPDAHPLPHQPGERLLVVRLTAANAPGSAASSAKRRELREHRLRRPGSPARPRRSATRSGRDWTGSSQRRKVMPLVLLLIRSGIHVVEIAEHGLAHQVGVQRGDAVDAVRAEEGEIAHAHAPAMRSRRSARGCDMSVDIIGMLGLHLVQEHAG